MHVDARLGLSQSRKVGSERGEACVRLLSLGFEAGKESLSLRDVPDQLFLARHGSPPPVQCSG
jgi:hypothetical protein